MAENVKKNDEGNQYLSFYLNNQMFAISVSFVREIIEYTQITRVPMMQGFISGVTNIRGNVIPVIDLAGRLGLSSGDITKKSCIITIESEIEGEDMEIGMVADMVDQVYDVKPEHKMDAPEFGSKIRKDFMHTMVKVEDKFMTLLDMRGVLNITELSRIVQKNSF